MKAARDAAAAGLFDQLIRENGGRIDYIPHTKRPVRVTAGAEMDRLYDDADRDIYRGTMETGAYLKHHEHPQAQVMLVLEGRVAVDMDGALMEYGANAVCVVPPNTRHDVRCLEACVLLIIYEPPMGRRDG